MPNVHELIRDHVTLSIRCLDRLYLHAYMPKLQTSGGLCDFLRDHLGNPIPSPTLFAPMLDRFVGAMKTFATPMSEDRHAPSPGSTGELLYDVNIPTPTHAERARTLVARIPTGTLCTLALEPEGYPYGSFVTVAFDEGHPVFLISGLAEHTKNLERDPRGSLLVAESGADDPLANGRVTMLGPCTRVEGDGGRARAAFLTVHPNAAYYADFRDFALWRLHVGWIRYIGGYGRMSWISQAEWRAAEPDPLAPSVAGIIAHMNDDHADAMVLYCKAFSKATDLTSATMTGIDRYGFEMSAHTNEGPRPIRLAFAMPVGTPDEARAALIAMLQDARRKLG